MQWLETWARRLRQLPLLIAPPDNLRRQDRRLAVAMMVEVAGDDLTVPCQAVNISSGGMLVNCPLPFLPGERVALRSTGFHREVEAMVLRVTAQDSALTFPSRRDGLTLMGWMRTQAARQHATAPVPGSGGPAG